VLNQYFVTLSLSGRSVV